MRRISTPALIKCLPCVQLRLSSQEKVVPSWSDVLPAFNAVKPDTFTVYGLSAVRWFSSTARGFEALAVGPETQRFDLANPPEALLQQLVFQGQIILLGEFGYYK